MTTSTYYVDASRVATNWGSAVSGGLATTNIYKLTITTDAVGERLQLAYASGSPVTSAQVTAAQAATTGGSVPAVVTKQANFGPAAAIGDFSKVAAATGAVTVNGRLANVIELDLTGNVTSLAISNPGAAGRMLELHFVQDSTGSRTLSGVNSAIKLAGGSLTLTTTASKRDVLRLRHLGHGAFVEAGRSLNI